MIYRVSKKDSGITIESKEFSEQRDAEEYAQRESLKYLDFRYEVAANTINSSDDDFFLIAIYKHGQLLARFDDISQK